MSTIRRQRWSWASSDKLMFAKVFWVKMAWLSTQQNCALLRVWEGWLTLGFLKDLTYLAYLGKEFAKITKKFRKITTLSLHSHWSYSIHFINALEAWKHLHVPAERLQLSMILHALSPKIWTMPLMFRAPEANFEPFPTGYGRSKEYTIRRTQSFRLLFSLRVTLSSGNQSSYSHHQVIRGQCIIKVIQSVIPFLEIENKDKDSTRALGIIELRKLFSAPVAARRDVCGWSSVRCVVTHFTLNNPFNERAPLQQNC
jgi:hypothetical protein